MNLLNECTKQEIELIREAGVIIEDKNYTEDELKKCELQIVEYIMSHSSKNGDIYKYNNQYSNILEKIKEGDEIYGKMEMS